MDVKQISEMVSAVCSSRTVTELTLRDGANRLTVRRALVESAPHAVAAPAAAAQTSTATAEYVVRSPLVGVFHHRMANGQPTATVGAVAQPGQVLGAIESMRMLYDVVAEVGGTITDVLVDEGQPVEYGQDLFHLQPTSEA